MNTEIAKKLDDLTIACSEIEAREYRKKALTIVNELRDMFNAFHGVVTEKLTPLGFNNSVPQPIVVDLSHSKLPKSLEGSTNSKPTNLVVEQPGGSSDVLLKQTQNCGLSYRTANCLRTEKIFYVGDLAEKTEDELLKIKNFGRSCVNEVEKFLSKNGLSLKA